MIPSELAGIKNHQRMANPYCIARFNVMANALTR